MPARFCQCVCVPERGKRENTCTLMPVSEVPGESIRRVQYKAKCQTVYMITPPDTPPPPAVYSPPTHLSVAKFQNLFFGSFHSLGGCVSTWWLMEGKLFYHSPKKKIKASFEGIPKNSCRGSRLGMRANCSTKMPALHAPKLVHRRVAHYFTSLQWTLPQEEDPPGGWAVTARRGVSLRLSTISRITFVKNKLCPPSFVCRQLTW